MDLLRDAKLKKQAEEMGKAGPKEQAYYGEEASTCGQLSPTGIQEPSAYESTLRGQLYKKRNVLFEQLREIDECLQSLSEPTVQKVLRVISVAG